MSRLLDRKWRVGALVVLLLGITGALAYAYWTTSGTGSGTAPPADTSAIVLNQTSTVAGRFPGGPAQTLSGTFDNPNSGPVFVGTIAATVSSVRGPNVSADTPCTAADYQLNAFPVRVGTEIPTGRGVGSWSGGSIQLLNTTTNQNGCKGATVTISYTVAG